MFALSYRYEGDVPLSAILPPREEHRQGDAVDLAAVPTAPRGYVFDGWYVDGALHTVKSAPQIAHSVFIYNMWLFCHPSAYIASCCSRDRLRTVYGQGSLIHLRKTRQIGAVGEELFLRAAALQSPKQVVQGVEMRAGGTGSGSGSAIASSLASSSGASAITSSSVSSGGASTGTSPPSSSGGASTGTSPWDKKKRSKRKYSSAACKSRKGIP